MFIFQLFSFQTGGYVKRMTVDNFKVQHRGGKGIKGMQTIEDDYIDDVQAAFPQFHHPWKDSCR